MKEETCYRDASHLKKTTTTRISAYTALDPLEAVGVEVDRLDLGRGRRLVPGTPELGQISID